MASIMGTAPSDAARVLPREPELRADEDAVKPSSDASPTRVNDGSKEDKEEEEEVEEEEGEQEEEEEGEEEEEEEELSPPKPRRTTRARLIMAESSDEDKGRKRRQHQKLHHQSKPVQSKPKDLESDSGSPPSSSEKLKRRRGRSVRQDPSKEDVGGESPADYVHIEVGDCVMLDSGEPDDHYVALVSSVQLSASSEKPTGFTAQWYYKPDDIRDEVLASIPGGVLPNEVFLSPHKDKNSIDAVVGICNVVPADEYVDIQQEIARGFREKSHKPYYVCRFKYYPSRSVKKALEPLKEEEVRGGLGPQKPKVGEEYQAAIPEMRGDKPTPVEEGIPWRLTAPVAPDKSIQVWSRKVVANQELVFRQFRAMLDMIRFSVGNVVRLYQATEMTTAMGHVRCIVLKFSPAEAVEVLTSTGERKATLKGDLCSPLSEDVALTILYAARFNLSHAVQQCTKVLVATQLKERDAFKQEILIFAQVAAQEKARLAALEESNNRKRRK